LAIDYLSHPDQLAQMGDRLRSVRGESGAAQKIAELVGQEIDFIGNSRALLAANSSSL